jgi:hypothetical protein
LTSTQNLVYSSSGWLPLHHLPGDFFKKRTTDHHDVWASMGLRFAWLEPSSVRNVVMMNFVLIHPSRGRWCIDWIEVQMGFSSIVSFRGLIIFFIFFLIFSFSILVSFLWFDFHLDIRKKFRVKFCIVFGSSLHSLIGFFLHFQRWDRSYLCECTWGVKSLSSQSSHPNFCRTIVHF